MPATATTTPETEPRRLTLSAVLDRFGIGALAHRPAHTLSGGETRRLALARAFVQDPAVTVQLVNSAGKCWTSEFTAEGTSKNGGGRFRAKAR